ncbi:hypothetical protein D3C80_2088810 [compost metagenome]
MVQRDGSNLHPISHPVARGGIAGEFVLANDVVDRGIDAEYPLNTVVFAPDGSPRLVVVVEKRPVAVPNDQRSSSGKGR